MDPMDRYDRNTWRMLSGLLAVALVLALVIIVAITHGGQ